MLYVLSKKKLQESQYFQKQDECPGVISKCPLSAPPHSSPFQLDINSVKDTLFEILILQAYYKDIPMVVNPACTAVLFLDFFEARLYLAIEDDLWDALAEYPEAKKMLLEKGKQILMKVQFLIFCLSNKVQTKEIERISLCINQTRLNSNMATKRLLENRFLWRSRYFFVNKDGKGNQKGFHMQIILDNNKTSNNIR